MSLVSAAPLFTARNSRSGYQIDQSLRFDGSSYLSRTPTVAGNSRQFTVSLWYKTEYKDSRPGGIQLFICPGGGTAFYTYAKSAAPADGKFYLANHTSGTPYNRTVGNYRDPSAWYHVVVSVDMDQSNGQDQQKMYVNGVRQTTESPQNPPAGVSHTWNSTVEQNISSSTTEKLYGYLAEIHSIDGQTLDPTSFGEFNANGVWVPKEVTGLTYGTNGFFLDFSDPSNIGADRSGNGNNFTPSGFTTSGTGTDVMSDTPTTNYCTWNPITTNSSGIALSEGNLFLAHAGSNDYGVIGTIGVTSGKWYWEGQLKNFVGFRHLVGVTHSLEAGNPNLIDKSLDTGFWGSRIVNGSTFYILENGVQVNTSASYPGSTPTSDSIMQFALDLDNLKWYIGFDGDWYNSGDPAAGTNATSTGLTSGQTWFPICELRSDEDSLWNFGQRDFSYTPPTGYKALNTSNLSAPPIKDGSDYFQTVLYTGNGADRNIDVADNSGNNWQPDLVWIKQRSGSDTDHRLFDQVRGGGAVIRSNNTNAEQTASDDGIYFAYADGFNIDYGTNGANYNGSGQTYAAWCWDAGGSGSSIATGSIDGTNPTIASTISANPTAGFSIVSHTGNTTAGATVGHGLGVAPSMIILKNRDTADHWPVYHASMGETKALLLDNDDAASTSSVWWNNTAPTSTVFSLGTGTTNYADDYIAYCFAEVEGYSKFGEYVGNANSDGTFVYTGFKPAWIMTKNFGDTGSWLIRDSVREPYNVTYKILPADNVNPEATSTGYYEVDILSNGFKIRTSNASINRNASDYVYAAFAEHPFGGSGVSPATAR